MSHLTPADILDGQLKEGLQPLDVTLLANDPNASTSSLIEQLAYSEIFKTIVPAVMCRYSLHRKFMSNTCGAFDAESDAPIMKVEASKPRPVVSDGDVYKAIVPSYTVFFVFFLVNFMARSVLHERELGTLRRLRIAPIQPILALGRQNLSVLVHLADSDGHFVRLRPDHLRILVGHTAHDADPGDRRHLNGRDGPRSACRDTR